MKNYFYAFSMCQSMFCSIPFPCHVWEEKARSKMLLFLPVIGLEVGFLWAALGWLCGWIGFPPLVSALFMTVLPFLLTGFIHLDGYMDVTDAVGSCRDLEKRRAILKDSHVGAFAVIGLTLLMLSQFAFFGSLFPGKALWVLTLIPMVSRCCAGFAVDYLPSMSTSQYAGRQIPWSHLWFFGILVGILTALGFLCFGRQGWAVAATAAACALAIRKGYKSLEGMNGDICGFSITVGELAGILVLSIV